MLGVFDAAFSDHWPDILMGAFLAALGYLMRRDISAMDRRHERAEDKFKEIDKTLTDIRISIAGLENRDSRTDT